MSAEGSSDAEAAGPCAAARGATIIAPPVVSSPFNVSRRFINVPHKNTAHTFPGHAASGRKVRRYRSQLEAHPRHDHAAEMVVLVIAVRTEERREGKEGVSTCRSRWSTYHTKT